MTGKSPFEAMKSGEALGRGMYSYAYVNEPNMGVANPNKIFSTVGMKGDNMQTVPRYFPISNSALAQQAMKAQ